MTNPCTPSQITYTVHVSEAKCAAKFGRYVRAAILMHENTHSPKIIRDTKRQEIVRGAFKMHFGKTKRSYRVRVIRKMLAEVVELNAAAAVACTGLGAHTI